jgi:hypothetical protein
MSEMRIVEGTTQFLLERENNKPTVSSSFEYVSGSLNSPYIITSSTVTELGRVDPPRPQRGKSNGR